MPRSEHSSKVLANITYSRNKASGRRSRSGPWEVNKELTTRTGKLSGRLGVKEKLARQNLKETAVQERNVRTLEKKTRLSAGKSTEINKVLGIQKSERRTLRDGRHIEKISVEGNNPSMLKTNHPCRDGKSLKKITPNTCEVCAAMAMKRQNNVWACNACSQFFYTHDNSKVSCRPCMVNIPLNA